jgi:hypothetical protein
VIEIEADGQLSIITTWIEEQVLAIIYRWMSDLKGIHITNMALISGCEIVIKPVQSKHFQPEAIIKMVENADCAV